jgi:hypothetical protein
MTMDPKICCAIFSTGIGYADRTRERHGDYVSLAHLFFSDLTLEIAKDCPRDLGDQIKIDAKAYQDRRGEQFQTSGSGQRITLGHDLPRQAA